MGPTIEETIRAIVREEIRRVLTSGAAVLEYTSNVLPPGIATRKAFARVCKSGVIPGATQDGPRGGWRVSREAWHAARTRKPKAPALRLVSAMTDEELAVMAVRGRGAR